MNALNFSCELQNYPGVIYPESYINHFGLNDPENLQEAAQIEIDQIQAKKVISIMASTGAREIRGSTKKDPSTGIEKITYLQWFELSGKKKEHFFN